MKPIYLVLLSIVVLAAPAQAKRYNKTEVECVPSPNPDVPPCDIDPLPIMPSEVAKKKADLEAKRKAAPAKKKPLNKKGGW